VVLENVWLTNKDNESLNSFQAELNYCRSSWFWYCERFKCDKMFLLTSVILN
jgi:hypothetical protein